MKKIILEFLLTFSLFLALWFGLSTINWISIFRINELNEKTEVKLGELTWKFLSDKEEEVTSEEAHKILDSLVFHITSANGIPHNHIKIHVLNSNEVNAFALPNGHLVLNSQLILDAENQEELMGVISHELAHIELKHVTEKLLKEIGLTVIISAVTGNNNEIIGVIAKKISSTAFDRHHETEADLTALIYLEKAKINPLPFTNFLSRMDADNELSDYLQWISTHPNSKDRSKLLESKINKTKTDFIQVIDSTTWKKLQEKM